MIRFSHARNTGGDDVDKRVETDPSSAKDKARVDRDVQRAATAELVAAALATPDQSPRTPDSIDMVDWEAVRALFRQTPLPSR